MSDDRTPVPKIIKAEMRRPHATAASADLSPMEARIEAVWTLTLECLAWRSDDVPRLDKSLVRVIRPRAQPGKE